MTVVLATLILGYSTAPIFAAQQVSASYSMPVQASVMPQASDCENSPGPTITLNGLLALSEIQAQLVFKNNLKGTHTHTEDTTATVTLIPEGESIQFPKQPSQGGVGGNPHIFLRFLDEDGQIIGNEFYLGRCVQDF